MDLFSKYDFASIEKRQAEASKKFSTQTTVKTADANTNNVFYEKTIKYLYNTVNSIKSDSSKPDLKNFFLSLEKTKGDYKKRDIKIYNKVSLLASFVKKTINKDPTNNLKHSLAGIYIEMWDMLNDPQNVAMFKKAFEIVDKKGEQNSSVEVFKLAYFSTVFALELATIHLVEFEIDIYSGKDANNSIIDIMKKHSSYMKNIVFPMIQLLAFFKTLKNPVNILQKLSVEEDNLKKAQGKESMTAVAATVGFLTTTVPGLSISVFVVIIAVALAIIPLIRYIIYWSKTLNIDTGKELELKAELLDNNILALKEKLENTSDENERKHIEDIISKQEVYVSKWRERSRKILQDENEANYIVETTIQKEDETKSDNTDFEIIL